MNGRVWRTGLMALAVLCLCAPAARAQLAAGIREQLYATLAANLGAFDRKDVAASMRTIDSRSPDYAPTKQAIEDQFKDLNVRSEIVSFDYMGHDDEFAVARAKVKTTGQPGSDFMNNTVDAVMLFHQGNGTWKLWSEDIVAIDLTP